jgi:hypothetical protein
MPLPTDQAILEIHRRHPRLTAPKIAQRLNCHPTHVRKIARRLDLKLYQPEGLYRLGQAARDAGLTVDRIAELKRMGALRP